MNDDIFNVDVYPTEREEFHEKQEHLVGDNIHFRHKYDSFIQMTVGDSEFRQ